MPRLPSGLELAITTDHIMEPDRNWFKGPADHFWMWVPAEENPPPFTPEQTWDGVPKSFPVPTSREMMAKYVRVCIGLEDGMMYWRGEMLSDFPKFGALDEEDHREWLEWCGLEKVEEFLDKKIEFCLTQAAINREATGSPVIAGAREVEPGCYEGVKTIDNPLKNSH